MKLSKTLFCLCLGSLLSCGLTFAQEEVIESTTSIPFAQELVEEDIETTPFSEEETENTVEIYPSADEAHENLIEVLPFTEEDTDAEVANVSSSQSKAVPEIKATPAQEAIINALVFGKTVKNLDNQSSPSTVEILEKFPGLSAINLTKLKSDYDINQIKAERTYKDKWLMALGTTGRIRDSQNPEIGPTMVLRDKDNPSSTIDVSFKDHESARNVLANLEPNQLILLVCKVDEYDGNQTKLTTCDFFNKVPFASTETLRKKFIDAVEGKGDKAANLPYAFFVLMFEKILNPDQIKVCEQGPAACVDLFAKLGTVTKPKDEYIAEVFNDLLDRGYTKEMIGDGSGIEKELTNFFN